MDEGGNTKDDLGLPKGTDDAEKLADQIKKDFDDGKELVVTVLKVGCPSCTGCSSCLLSVQAIVLKECKDYQATNAWQTSTVHTPLEEADQASICHAGHGRGDGIFSQGCSRFWIDCLCSLIHLQQDRSCVSFG